jgi:hypothetical protein
MNESIQFRLDTIHAKTERKTKGFGHKSKRHFDLELVDLLGCIVQTKN